MSLLEDLSALGADTGEALDRFMGKTSLYERMLGKLKKAVDDDQVMPCFEAGDIEGALEKAHTLKGVMGNLSITPLYNGYSEIVKLLRENRPDDARKILADILPAQEKIIECISKYQ